MVMKFRILHVVLLSLVLAGCAGTPEKPPDMNLSDQAFEAIAAGDYEKAEALLEVALSINQGVSHGKGLCHPYNGIVNGRITVRMVLPDDIAYYPGRLLVRPVMVVLQLFHSEQNSPVGRFKSVSYIWQCPANNYAHGIFQIRPLHLFFYGDSTHVSCL